MNRLLLIGGGGHCRSAIDVIEAQGQYSIAGIVQRQADGAEPVMGYPILGADENLPELVSTYEYALVTVGQIKTAAVRRRLFESLTALNAALPTVISPRAYVSRHATVGEGTLIMHGAIVNAAAKIGVNGIVNSMALIEHGAEVGDHCHISTGARVNGDVVVADDCFVGSGAVLREGVRIGARSVIGAGVVVLRDVAPETVIKAHP